MAEDIFIRVRLGVNSRAGDLQITLQTGMPKGKKKILLTPLTTTYSNLGGFFTPIQLPVVSYHR